MSFYEHFSEKEQEVLRMRAERIASTQQQVQQGDAISALVIQLGGETYALPMEALTAVYVGHTVIPLPCVPSYVAGIANVRGQILTVLDLAILLRVPGKAAQGALIVASNGDTSVGFCVQAIGDATTILTHELHAVPSTLNNAYLIGVLPNGTALLNVSAIFTDQTLTVDQAD